MNSDRLVINETPLGAEFTLYQLPLCLGMSQIVFKNFGSEIGSHIKIVNQRAPISDEKALGRRENPKVENSVDFRSVRINRSGSVKLYPFTDFFKGFERVEAVRSIFGSKTESVLKNLRVEFFSFKYGYMAVSDIDGHLVVSTYHLQNSDFKVLYLGIIHELVHVRQFMEGKQLFNSEFDYVDNPTEIGAYGHAVKEAQRIGMSRAEIIEYLKAEWISKESHERLVESVGLHVAIN